MDYWDNENNIRQNLIDAGCNEEQVDELIKKIKNGEIKTCLKQLSNHRGCLLDNLHKEQKCIDCLDYLIYQIEKRDNK